MSLKRQYEHWSKDRYEHLGDIGFADAVLGVMNYERLIIKLYEASPEDRNELIGREYGIILDLLDDYEWDKTLSEESD